MKSKLIYLLLIGVIAASSLKLSGQTYFNKEAEKIASDCKTARLNEKNKSIKFLQLRDDVNQPSTNKEAWLKRH